MTTSKLQYAMLSIWTNMLIYKMASFVKFKLYLSQSIGTTLEIWNRKPIIKFINPIKMTGDILDAVYALRCAFTGLPKLVLINYLYFLHQYTFTCTLKYSIYFTFCCVDAQIMIIHMANEQMHFKFCYSCKLQINNMKYIYIFPDVCSLET